MGSPRDAHPSHRSPAVFFVHLFTQKKWENHEKSNPILKQWQIAVLSFWPRTNSRQENNPLEPPGCIYPMDLALFGSRKVGSKVRPVP